MTEISKSEIACQDRYAGEIAIKCPFQQHNRMARVGFKSRLYVDHNYGALITPPRCRQSYGIFPCLVIGIPYFRRGKPGRSLTEKKIVPKNNIV